MKISMDMIRTGASHVVKRISDNMPVILIGCGIAGVGLTVYEAVKATPKANQQLEALEKKKDEELKYPRPVEKGIVLGKHYWKTALIGGASIACFLKSHDIDVKRQAVTAAAYSLCEKSLEDYKDKTLEIAGPKKAEEIDTAVAREPLITYNLSNVPGTGPLWIFDFSKAAFRADRQVIEAGVNKFNSDLVRCTGMASFSGEISMNDIQDYFAEVANSPQLHQQKHPLGDQFGFSMEKTGQIDPNIKWGHDSAGNPCGILRFCPKPLVTNKNLEVTYYE